MARLAIQVTPGARTERIALEDDAIRVWVLPPPLDGRANRRVEEILARAMRVPKSRVSIVRGAAGRSKLIDVEGLDVDGVLARLREHVEKAARPET